MFSNNSNRDYPAKCPRAFTDNPNRNNLYYRDSETHAQITKC